ncbi:hypothetical protein GOODEAATRI_002286 [Goodea atripinnis]|uniref:Uncharacterized protein n=1 Tax=Goodea atripinnis TaxID=208336 RepID=A0ABV0N9P4_9TELE
MDGRIIRLFCTFLGCMEGLDGANYFLKNIQTAYLNQLNYFLECSLYMHASFTKTIKKTETWRMKKRVQLFDWPTESREGREKKKSYRNNHNICRLPSLVFQTIFKVFAGRSLQRFSP